MQYFPPGTTRKTLPDLYNKALSVIRDSIMCDGISILVRSVDGNSLRFVTNRTFARDLLKGLTLSMGTGIAGLAAAQSKGVISNRVDSHPAFFTMPDQMSGFKTRGVLCCPMRHAGQVIGAIELVNKADGHDFDQEELEATQTLADVAAADWRREVGPAPRETFYELTRKLRKIVDVEGISLFVLDEAGENLRLRFSDTTCDTGLNGIRIGMNQGVVGAVASDRQSILVPSVQEDSRFFKGVDAMSMFSTHSIIAAPVLDADDLLGVVELVNAWGSESFTESDRQILDAIAAELGEQMGSLSR